MEFKECKERIQKLKGNIEYLEFVLFALSYEDPTLFYVNDVNEDMFLNEQKRIQTQQIELNKEQINETIDMACKLMITNVHFAHKLINVQNGLSWKADDRKKILPISLLNPSPLARNEVWDPSDLLEQQMQASERSTRVMDFTTHFWNIWGDIGRTQIFFDHPYFKHQITLIYQSLNQRKLCNMCRVNYQDMAILRDGLQPAYICPEQKQSVCLCTNRLYDLCSSCIIKTAREEFLANMETYLETRSDNLSIPCLFCCETCNGLYCIYQFLHLPSKLNIDRERITITEEKKKLPVSEILQTVNDALIMYSKKEQKHCSKHDH